MSIAQTLIDRFQELDGEAEPGGLYAADKQVLWTKWLYPSLKKHGARMNSHRLLNVAGKFAIFSESDGRTGMLQFLSVSSIKIRKFGDRHAIDPRMTFPDRWDARRIEKKIGELWKEQDDTHRLFALVGFAESEEPFRNEFAALSRIDLESLGVVLHKRAWRDIRDRGFSSVAAIWENKPSLCASCESVM